MSLVAELQTLAQNYANRLDMQLKALSAPKARQLSPKVQLSVLERLHQLSDSTTLVESAKHLERFSKGAPKQVYHDIIEATRAGLEAMSALEGYFPTHIVSGLVLAEQRGALQEAMVGTCEYLEQQQQGLKPVLMGLLYPTMIFFAALAISVVVYGNIKDALGSSKINLEELPSSFAILDAVSLYTQVGLLPTIITLVVAAVGLRHYLNHNVSDLRLSSLDRFPIFAEFRLLLCARFLNTFTLLIDQRVPEIEAIKIIRSTSGSTYFRHHLRLIEGRIQSGASRSQSFATGLFDDEANSLLQAVGDTKHFNTGLKRTAAESQRRFLTNAAIYAAILKAVFFASAVFIALNIFGVIRGLESALA